jgi:mannose-6-phosphate isomerase-like protein (cupin superfamily)
VRKLLARAGGSMAHFRLAAGQVARAVRHRTVDEIWFILSGTGAMWQGDASGETVIELVPGLCLTIPFGTAFQFRAGPDEALTAVAINLPPLPGQNEAEPVPGHWPATV